MPALCYGQRVLMQEPGGHPVIEPTSILETQWSGQFTPEIQTGKRRVIEFLLRPIEQAMRESLGERGLAGKLMTFIQPQIGAE